MPKSHEVTSMSQLGTGTTPYMGISYSSYINSPRSFPRRLYAISGGIIAYNETQIVSQTGEHILEVNGSEFNSTPVVITPQWHSETDSTWQAFFDDEGLIIETSGAALLNLGVLPTATRVRVVVADADNTDDFQVALTRLNAGVYA